MPENFDDVHQSYGRCLRSRNFIIRFYEILMDSDPSMRSAFARTDLGTQRRALRRGITTAIMYAAGSDLVEDGVNKMAEVHSRRGRAPVHPSLYPLWLDCLVQAIRENDPQLTSDLEHRWRQAMGVIIERFSTQY